MTGGAGYDTTVRPTVRSLHDITH